MLVWLSVWTEVQILLHMVQLMPLHPKTPSSLASFKSRLVLPSSTGLPRLPGKEAVKQVYVCVYSQVGIWKRLHDSVAV